VTDTEDAGHIARAFAQTIWQERDFALASLLMDPLLRLCMAQQWIWDNWAELERAGLDRDRLAAAVSEPAPTHPLWTDFKRVQMRAFDLWPRLSEWGVTTTERLVQPDVQLIFWVEPGIEEIPNGELFAGYPCLQRRQSRAGAWSTSTHSA